MKLEEALNKDLIRDVELWLLNIPTHFNKEDIEISKEWLIEYLVAAAPGNTFSNQTADSVYFNFYVIWSSAGYFAKTWDRTAWWSLPEGTSFSVEPDIISSE